MTRFNNLLAIVLSNCDRLLNHFLQFYGESFIIHCFKSSFGSTKQAAKTILLLKLRKIDVFLEDK